ncbi:MAG: riboflavin biosynthesis protein RibD, partial [Bacteroidetes bacterium RIFCSPHIGHO2_02_FULL_44_7]
EPCSHFDKTPPCVDLIIKHKIPQVVIGCVDPFAKVNGQGIKKLEKAGVDIKVNILQNECRALNKNFFTYHEKKRPYIILKWAETADRFIDAKRDKRSGLEAMQISNRRSKILIHKWRSQMEAIMVGTNTALLDNPHLTTREVRGRNPLRIAIDRDLKIPKQFNLLDKSTPTIIFTGKNVASKHNLEFVKINFKKNIIPQILNKLCKRGVQSLMVEGGAQLLNSFIKNNLWDEMRVFSSKKKIKNGVKAPVIDLRPKKMEKIGSDKLQTFLNI